MSYIEKKYLNKINEIFEDLINSEKHLLELLKDKSLKHGNDIAKSCAEFNNKINLILKTYYPEIKNLDDKLEIKATLKFYYDLIDKLTDFIRKIEDFQKIDEKYYNKLIEFVQDKDSLIFGKYHDVCSQELTAFYDLKSRENLERIIAEKFEKRSRQFFTIGPLEEEIKKMAMTAGADQVSIKTIEGINEEDSFESAQSVINFSLELDNEKRLMEVGEEIKKYLESKKYKVKLLRNSVITDAKLFPD